MVSEIEHISPLDGSGHNVLMMDLHCYIDYGKPKTKYSYDKGDYETAKTILGWLRGRVRMGETSQ